MTDHKHTAHLARWAAAHWRDDHMQPHDLDKFLMRVGELLDRVDEDMVHRYWMYTAVVQSMVIVIMTVFSK